MKGNPWAFKDSTIEREYQIQFAQTLLDRSKALLKWNLIGVWIVNATVSWCGLAFGQGDMGLYVGICIRMVASVTGTILFLIKWSKEYKPKVAHWYLWMTRAAFAFAAAIQVGMNQPDSKLKTMLLWSMYVGGAFFPTFEEYLLCSVSVAYLELVVLIVWSRGCPVDSSRPCTVYELSEQFGHHTLYICIAAWIQFHLHTDRRKEFRRTVRDRGSLRGASSSPLDATDETENMQRSESGVNARTIQPHRTDNSDAAAPPASELNSLRARPVAPSTNRSAAASQADTPCAKPADADASVLWGGTPLPREEAVAGAALGFLVRPLPPWPAATPQRP